MSSMYVWQHRSMGVGHSTGTAQNLCLPRAPLLSSAFSVSTVTPHLSSPEDPQLEGF